jgi:GDPmannose 4,6-dehydratase
MDGSHLADFLLEKGYTVYGLERRSSASNRTNISHIEDKIHFLKGDLTDQNSLLRALKESNPDEIYNLAAQFFVGESWNTPEHTSEVTGLGVLRILEAIREYGSDKIKFYQASSSEMFGQVREIPQNEKTPFHPRSPYGVAKTFGHYITVNYRESYSAFAVSGILFNHESPRRGAEFVSRKITKGVARIALGDKNPIKLGNLDARRDWGHAKDYVEAMHLMLQQTNPKDYVIGTGITHSVRELLTVAFAEIGINNWDKYVIHDPAQIRPAEVDLLVADTQSAKEELGWIPKTTFEELISEMVQYDIKELRKN